MILALPDPAATHSLGVRLGRAAFPGVILALNGDLGAGKTALVRGVGEGLAITDRVQSPTFVLVQPHEGRLVLWHADAYRLGDVAELEALELFELGADGVVALEWAGRFPEALPADRLEVTLVEAGEGRVAEICATGPRHAALEAALGA